MNKSIYLSLADRINLQNSLNSFEGSFTEMITLESILSDCKISELEMEQAELRTVKTNEGEFPDWKNEIDKEVFFGNERTSLIRKHIMQLANEKKLHWAIQTTVFDEIPLDKDQLKDLMDIVSDLDKSGKINRRNYQICVKIKERYERTTVKSVDNKETTTD